MGGKHQPEEMELFTPSTGDAEWEGKLNKEKAHTRSFLFFFSHFLGPILASSHRIVCSVQSTKDR